MSLNKSLDKTTLLKSVFSDPKNYPYGFSRSGDFSIAESKALSAYGCLIAALVDGKIRPETDEDKQFILAAHGEIEPQDTTQRAWVKYQKRINRPKACSIYSSKKSATNEADDDDVSDIDDDLELNIDED